MSEATSYVSKSPSHKSFSCDSLILLFVCTPNTENRCSSESDDYKEAAVVRCASVIWSHEQIKSYKTVSQTGPPRAGSDPGENFFWVHILTATAKGMSC
jgi:hypothetical protein